MCANVYWCSLISEERESSSDVIILRYQRKVRDTTGVSGKCVVIYIYIYIYNRIIIYSLCKSKHNLFRHAPACASPLNSFLTVFKRLVPLWDMNTSACTLLNLLHCGAFFADDIPYHPKLEKKIRASSRLRCSQKRS